MTSAKDAAYWRAYNARRGRRPSKSERDGERPPPPAGAPPRKRPIIALDGEGHTLASGAHRYTYMAACTSERLVLDLHRPKGITAPEALSFLLQLPAGALLVGYALGYDRTKWLESWPDESLWHLMRPEERLGEQGPLPVACDSWRVNIVSTRMTVRQDARRRTVWDVFKFFQTSFVKALGKWSIGTPAERAHVEREKARRGNFKGIGKREQEYCQLECRLAAQLVRALLDAHEEEDIKLPSYYGPGSTASVLLKGMSADRQRARIPEEMREPVAAAYFGGRFECARVGPVKARALYAYDIASAYPAAFARLPCMRHGSWEWHEDPNTVPLVNRGAILVRFRVDPHEGACRAWGPLPHRMPDGNILFPVVSAGGWAWLDEFVAARALHPGVTATGAWAYHACDCPPPFASTIADLYARRLAWGKGARGIVLKLALNSLYGKSAQRVGTGRFRCMVRAGLVTSMTRAQLLRAVALARDPWNVLELATDSVLSLEPLALESEGLGGWERKPWPGGVFLLRPGLRFPLLKESEASLTAARGIGPKTLHKNRARVLRAWDRQPMGSVTLHTPSFFHGAKLSVRRSLAPDDDPDARSYVYTRDRLYGRWTEETRTLNYRPQPKRESVSVAPGRGKGYLLHPWELPRGEACRSAPYGVAPPSPQADDLDDMRDLSEDQPEGSGGLALL
jgi:hypothetical protein